MPPTADKQIPGELKSNYIDLHETTGESYESIAGRIRAAGGSETLADWVEQQKDTHVRGRGDTAVTKAEARVQDEEHRRTAAAAPDDSTPAAPVVTDDLREQLRDELRQEMRGDLDALREELRAEAAQARAADAGTDGGTPPASATGTPGKRTAKS